MVKTRRIGVGVIALAFVLWLPMLPAETLHVGNSEEDHTDVCSAIAAAETGDVIEIAGPSAAGKCGWNTSGLTIRGVGVRPTITMGADSGWFVSAGNTVIENIAIRGTRCESGSCIAIDLLSGGLTLRGVSITGSDTAVRAQDADSSVVKIERCEFVANGSSLEIGSISRFSLTASNVRDSLSGAVVRTSARENDVRNNRLAGGADASASAELVIAGSALSTVVGNVFLRTGEGATAGLIQYVDVTGQRGTLTLDRNTFVNQSRSGIVFTELIGDQAPTVQNTSNVFWGDGPIGDLANANAASANYAGLDDVFRSAEDFQLTSGIVPQNWGAFSLENGFPLRTVETASSSSSSSGSSDSGSVEQQPRVFSLKDTVTSTLTGAAPRTVALTSTVLGGVGYVFGNRVHLTSPAPTGGVSVALSSSNASVLTFLSNSLQISAGQTSGTFTFRTLTAAAATTVAITASANGGRASASVQIAPAAISNIALASREIGSNGTVVANRVYLTGPAPAGGMVVRLTSSCARVTVPSSITIPGGISSGTFTINAGFVTAAESATITASNASSTKSASLSVLPVGVKSILVAPGSLSGGQPLIFKVYLNGPAPAGGIVVSLSSSNQSVLPLPATMTVPAGSTYYTVVPRVAYVPSITSVSVSAASRYSSAAGTFRALPTQLGTLLSSSSTTRSAGNVTLVVRLNGPAPAAGMVVSLSSSNPAALPVPASVRIPAGVKEYRLTVTSRTVGGSTPVTISGTAAGSAKSVVITVTR